MKIRVADFRSVPSEIRQVDGKWVVFDRLVVKDEDGGLWECFSGDRNPKFHPVDLPERRQRKRGRRSRTP